MQVTFTGAKNLSMAILILAIEDLSSDVPFDIDPDDEDKIREVKESAEKFLSPDNRLFAAILGVWYDHGVESPAQIIQTYLNNRKAQDALNSYKRRRRKRPKTEAVQT